MQISVSTRHGHLSEATQEKLRAKAEKLVRIFDRLMSIEIVVDLKDEAKPKVDLQVSAEHKHDFVAREVGPTPEAAADQCLHKIENQLRRYKEKSQNHKGDVPQGGFPSRSGDQALPDEPS